VGALAHQVGISKAAVSQHLQILRKAGLVKGEKRGYWTHYMVEKEALRQMAGDLTTMADLAPCTQGICSMTSPDGLACVETCSSKAPDTGPVDSESP
jgi:DNA-binding transcriptional MocR family regulator